MMQARALASQYACDACGNWLYAATRQVDKSLQINQEHALPRTSSGYCLRVSNKDWTEEFCYQEDTRIVAANQSRGGRSKAVWIQGPRYEDQGAATAEAAQLEFTFDEILCQGSNTEVYRGILSGPGDSQRTVICKLVEGDTCPLKYEAGIYTKTLKHLQGTDIPEFIGFYRLARAKDPRLSVACILLEDFGDMLDGWLGNYSMEVRRVLSVNVIYTGAH